MKWGEKHTISAGVLLILAVNAVALTGVYLNRSGPPESTFRLSQRELHMPYGWRGSEENSGIALTLQWRVLAPDQVGQSGRWYYYGTNPVWLDSAKMASLGFDTSATQLRRYKSPDTAPSDSKEALLVLELDGPAYQESLKRAQRHATTGKDGAEALKDEQTKLSRLFVVDAGLDLSVLRARFPDRKRYAIARGQVGTRWEGPQGNYRMVGVIRDLSVTSVNVPINLRRVFDTHGGRETGQTTPDLQYEVDVAYGQRLEPWITAAYRQMPAQ